MAIIFSLWLVYVGWYSQTLWLHMTVFIIIISFCNFSISSILTDVTPIQVSPSNSDCLMENDRGNGITVSYKANHK